MQVYQSGTKYFGYLLEDDGLEIENGITSLKRLDRSIVKSLEIANKKLPENEQFSFHLALLKRTTSKETRTNSQGKSRPFIFLVFNSQALKTI